MKNVKVLSLALITGISLSACSNSSADTNNTSIKQSTSHHQMHEKHHNNEENSVDDLQKVNFMDENLDMSKIEQHSCCDE